jgi:hypothetical protein
MRPKRDRFFLPIFPALLCLSDLSKAIWQWILKAERAKRGASERAAIKAEVTRAKKPWIWSHGAGSHTP